MTTGSAGGHDLNGNGLIPGLPVPSDALIDPSSHKLIGMPPLSGFDPYQPMKNSSIIRHFMTIVTPHEIAFGIGHGLVFDPKGSGNRHLCQRGARQILPMACFAIALVVLVIILMAVVIPAGIVDVVKAMGATGCTW